MLSLICQEESQSQSQYWQFMSLLVGEGVEFHSDAYYDESTILDHITATISLMVSPLRLRAEGQVSGIPVSSNRLKGQVLIQNRSARDKYNRY